MDDERELQRAARWRRVEIEDEFLEIVRAVFDKANIVEVDQEQARRWLPQLRQFLCDMLMLQRQEFEGCKAGEPAGRGPVVTADDLREAQRALERGQAAGKGLRGQR